MYIGLYYDSYSANKISQLYLIQNVFSLYICQYSEGFLHTDTHPAGLPPKKMVLWDILSKGAPEGLWLSSFLMEMETNHSEVAQTEANAYKEDQVTKCKETEAHAMEGETLLKQEGHTVTENTEGNICNGESRVCLHLHTYIHLCKQHHDNAKPYKSVCKARMCFTNTAAPD